MAQPSREEYIWNIISAAAGFGLSALLGSDDPRLGVWSFGVVAFFIWPWRVNLKGRRRAHRVLFRCGALVTIAIICLVINYLYFRDEPGRLGYDLHASSDFREGATVGGGQWSKGNRRYLFAFWRHGGGPDIVDLRFTIHFPRRLARRPLVLSGSIDTTGGMLADTKYWVAAPVEFGPPRTDLLVSRETALSGVAVVIVPRIHFDAHVLVSIVTGDNTNSLACSSVEPDPIGVVEVEYGHLYRGRTVVPDTKEAHPFIDLPGGLDLIDKDRTLSQDEVAQLTHGIADYPGGELDELGIAELID